MWVSLELLPGTVGCGIAAARIHYNPLIREADTVQASLNVVSFVFRNDDERQFHGSAMRAMLYQPRPAPRDMDCLRFRHRSLLRATTGFPFP